MKSELTLDKTYRRGDRGQGVRRVQEWLNLHDVKVDGKAVGIDEDFGPQTERALKQFQVKHGLPVSGVGTSALRRTGAQMPTDSNGPAGSPSCP